jgi:hypothetical protein
MDQGLLTKKQYCFATNVDLSRLNSVTEEGKQQLLGILSTPNRFESRCARYSPARSTHTAAAPNL